MGIRVLADTHYIFLEILMNTQYFIELAEQALTEKYVRYNDSLALANFINVNQYEYKFQFFKKFITSPRDISKLFEFIELHNEKRSHALIRASREYLQTLTDRRILNYQMGCAKYNMYDIISITHATSRPINRYMRHRTHIPASRV